MIIERQNHPQRVVVFWNLLQRVICVMVLSKTAKICCDLFKKASKQNSRRGFRPRFWWLRKAMTLSARWRCNYEVRYWFTYIWLLIRLYHADGGHEKGVPAAFYHSYEATQGWGWTISLHCSTLIVKIVSRRGFRFTVDVDVKIY